MLTKMFGHTREEATGHWKRFCNVELYGLYPSPNFIRVIKLTRIWVGYLARLWDKRDLLGKPEGYGRDIWHVCGIREICWGNLKDMGGIFGTFVG